MVGVGRYLKKKNKQIINLGVVRSPNNPVPGPRTENLLRQIAFDWRGVIDSLESVGTIDSYKYSLKLIRNGIVAGPSSGFNLKGLLKYLQRMFDENKLDELRNTDGEIIAVFITCDTPLPYIDEYFKYLESSEFPEIEHKELLVNNYNANTSNSSDRSILQVEVPECTVLESYNEIFKESPEDLWKLINEEQGATYRDNVVVLDIRKRNDFDNFHIPNAINIEEENIEKEINYIAQKYSGKKFYVFCYRGNSSQRVAALLNSVNINAFSVKGGMIEWSEVGLPRIRPEICRINQGIKQK